MRFGACAPCGRSADGVLHMNPQETFPWNGRVFDLITEISKQVITLSTAVITLGITFNKEFIKPEQHCAKFLLGTSWFFFIVAVFSALLTLTASAGVQGKTQQGTGPDPYSGNIRKIAAVQLIAFFLGLFLTLITGFVTV